MSRRSRPRAQQRRLQNLRAARGAAPTAGRGQQPAARNWYRIVDLVDAPDTAAIYLYEEIGYWGVTAQDFVRDLMGLRVSNIIVHINSPGGDVFDGLAIFHALRDHPANVEVRVDGLAASAASFIAMAGDTVVCQRNAQMMIHDASGICIGNASDMQEMVDLLDRCSDNIADIYAQRAGGTTAQWRAAMQAETWYTGLEAVAAGLADSTADPGEETGEETAVVPGEDDEALDELMNRSWDLSIYTYAGRAKAPEPRAIAEQGEAPAATGEPVDAAETATEEAAAVEPRTSPTRPPPRPTRPPGGRRPGRRRRRRRDRRRGGAGRRRRRHLDRAHGRSVHPRARSVHRGRAVRCPAVERNSGMTTMLNVTPGQRDRLARLGVRLDDLGRVTNRVKTVAPKNVHVPKNSDELAEMIADQGKMKPVLTTRRRSRTGSTPTPSSARARAPTCTAWSPRRLSGSWPTSSATRTSTATTPSASTASTSTRSQGRWRQADARLLRPGRQVQPERPRRRARQQVPRLGRLPRGDLAPERVAGGLRPAHGDPQRGQLRFAGGRWVPGPGDAARAAAGDRAGDRDRAAPRDGRADGLGAVPFPTIDVSSNQSPCSAA
jgi:ATP-dependent protease ClpP protease subunit